MQVACCVALKLMDTCHAPEIGLLVIYVNLSQGLPNRASDSVSILRGHKI